MLDQMSPHLVHELLLDELDALHERMLSAWAKEVDASWLGGSPGLITRSRCPDCRDTGILPGFGFGTSIDACDRPCSCDAGKRKADGDGPTEWTVVKREVRSEPSMEDGSYSAEHVTVQRGQQIARFRVVAHHGDDYFATDIVRVGHVWGGDVLHIRGEACIPMAIDRLLVGLREGTVVP